MERRSGGPCRNASGEPAPADPVHSRLPAPRLAVLGQALSQGDRHASRLAFLLGTHLSVSGKAGFAIPMMIGTTVAAVSVFASMLFSPETKGTQMVADIQLA